MAKKVLIVLLIVVGFLVLGASRSDTDYGRFQLVTGTIRVDLSTTVTQGMSQVGQEKFEDRPTCFKIDTQTGQVWVYNREINVNTNASGRTRETTFEGFKLLQ
jgi:hypothetical protein